MLPAATISVTQNFFAVGGHSLLAMRLIATIRGLAERIDLIGSATATIGDDAAFEGEF